jgi:hypothetical protein
MKQIVLTAGVIGAAFAVAVSAQNRESQPGRAGRLASPIAAAIDTDHDGVISGAEMDASAAALKTLDANSDGRLTADELRPSFRAGARRGGPDGSGARPPRADAGSGRAGRGGGPGHPVARALDTDRDGALSQAEVASAAAALKALDANADGQISGDEWRPRPRRGAGAGRGQ